MKLFSKAIVLALGTALAGAAHAAEYLSLIHI